MVHVDIPELWSEENEANAQTFVSAVESERLDDALLAIEDARPGAVVDVRRHIDEWSELVRKRRTMKGPRDDAQALRAVLGLQAGLSGDRNDYHNPHNSMLSRVIADRRGLPILLSSVWILVGRGAGLTVDGVGMPGHFIAQVGGPDGVLVDPFRGGARLTRDECVGLVSRLSGGKLNWTDRFLQTSSFTALVERVLRNLMGSYQRRRDFLLLYRTANLLSRLRPEDASVQLLHAQIAAQVGAPSWALELYRDISTQFAGTRSETVAKEQISRLESEQTFLN